MAARKLTTKQEKFCLYYVEHGNASDAYRHAYDVGVDTKNVTIHGNSKQIMRKSNIIERISDLRDELKATHSITINWIIAKNVRMVEAWEELIEMGMESEISHKDKGKFYLLKEIVKGSDYRGCLDQLAKLTGAYEPVRQEVAVKSITVDIRRNNK